MKIAKSQSQSQPPGFPKTTDGHRNANASPPRPAGRPGGGGVSPDLEFGDAKAMLDGLGNKIEAGLDKAIGAASAWNRTILVDATLHTSKLNPCKTGYMADAAGKCTVCDFTLSMVPGCNACVDPGTCSGCGEGYTFVAAPGTYKCLGPGACK